MNETNCYYAETESCPLHIIHVPCEVCIKNNCGEIVKKAVDDYEGLGPAFSNLFSLLNKLIKNEGKVVELTLPYDTVHLINRVITALFNSEDKTTIEKLIYKRLIFYFFKCLVEEFESMEYPTDENLN